MHRFNLNIDSSLLQGEEKEKVKNTFKEIIRCVKEKEHLELDGIRYSVEITIESNETLGRLFTALNDPNIEFQGTIVTSSDVANAKKNNERKLRSTFFSDTIKREEYQSYLLNASRILVGLGDESFELGLKIQSNYILTKENTEERNKCSLM